MANVKWVGGYSGATTDASNVNNWSTASLPTTSDNVYIEANPSGTDYSIEAGLTALQGVALASLNIGQNYTGNIGTTSSYFLTAATLINVGYQYGGTSTASGSSLIRLNNGTVNATTTIYNTAASGTMANGPFQFLGTHSSNTLNVLSGIVSVAADPTESATIATLNTGGTVTLGTGVTITTANVYNGALTLRSAITTITQTGGNVVTAGTGAITTFNLRGGSANFTSTGTITTLNIQSATADFSQDPRAKTVTNCTMYAGGTLNVNNGVKGSITFSNNVIVTASPGNFTLTAWPNTTFALS